MQTLPLGTTQTQAQVSGQSVYPERLQLMAAGLALTGVVALYVASSETLIQMIFSNQLLFFGLTIGELALVFFPECKNPEDSGFDSNRLVPALFSIKRPDIVVCVSDLHPIVGCIRLLLSAQPHSAHAACMA